MPPGKVHALATCITAGVLTPIVYLVGQSLPNALAFAGGCMIGLVVTPDLDVRVRDTHAETVMRRTGGCLGAIWDMLWLPYAWLIPHHRHPLSHWPIIGTITRLTYLAAVPALLWWVIGHIIPLPTLPYMKFSPWLCWLVGGLILVDMFHSLMDGLA